MLFPNRRGIQHRERDVLFTQPPARATKLDLCFWKIILLKRYWLPSGEISVHFGFSGT